MEIFKLLGKIVIDASGVDTTLSETTTTIQVFSENVCNFFKDIADKAAEAFSLDKLKEFAMGCVEMYGDVAAEEAAFAQIMGDYAGQAEVKLEQLSENTGIASSRMLSQFTMMTNKFLGQGYSIEEATDLAAQGMLIAADTAAMYNMSLDEACGHLNSFINGSYEGGEAIGLFSLDTQMAQKALEQGFITDKNDWSGLDEGRKMLFRLTEAQQQLEDGKVSGQSLLESDSYQNTLANVQAKWRETQAIIGEPLMNDIILPALTKLMDVLQTVIDNKDAIQGALKPFADVLGSLAVGGLELLQNTLEWMTENEDRVKGVFTAIGLAFAGIALATHPILTVLSALVGFVMWLAGNADERRAEYVAAHDNEHHTVAQDNAGKYAHWTDEQKDAAYDYLYAYDGGYSTAAEVEAMKAAGLSQAAIDEFRSDVSNALAEGDYSITIEDTWFDEATETNLQTELDGMGLETTVTLTPDYSAVQAYMDSGGTVIPGVTDVNGSHASGLDRVPFDGYRAILHKDEAVLNATNAAVWRNGGGIGNSSRLEGLMQQVVSVLNQVATNTGRTQNVVLDSGALVGQIAPAMDIQLGTIMARKGRRNG